MSDLTKLFRWVQTHDYQSRLFPDHIEIDIECVRQDGSVLIETSVVRSYAEARDAMGY